MKYISVHKLILTILSLFILTGCQNSPQTRDDEEDTPRQLSIVTTTTHITDLVRQLTGEVCEILPMMGPGVDPHLYQPSARDLQSLRTADLIVFHGLQLEGKLASAFESTGLNSEKIYSISSQIDEALFLPAEEKKGKYFDPHLWFDPEIWTDCMNGLANKLVSIIPAKKGYIEQRAKELADEYARIHEFGVRKIAQIPSKQRILVTSHDAFRYFGKSFEMEVVALQGISTAAEAGLADRSNLVDYLKVHKVPCIFIESSVNPKALREIAKEASVQLGEPLFSDALGPTDAFIQLPNGTNRSLATWSGMMTYNIHAIYNGLAGKKK